ncbi:MAG: NYN domain-containing protein [Melioribacteraceae bacterium]|nr:NYN domain-containing protein [Melioribacteraceae bacterium]
MIKHYIIDGNNLIGKIPKLWEVQKKDKQSSRERLAFLLERYFHGRKIKVTLHFDGHPNQAIKAANIKIEYSRNAIADSNIKREISNASNPKVIAVVSSDHNVQDFAKVSSCKIIKSENFAKELFRKEEINEEDSRIKGIDNDEMKKMFGIE